MGNVGLYHAVVSDMLNENSRSSPNGEVLPEEIGNIAGSNIDWLGQHWLVFVGLTSLYTVTPAVRLPNGDWLQLLASSWFIANMAALQ